MQKEWPVQSTGCTRDVKDGRDSLPYLKVLLSSARAGLRVPSVAVVAEVLIDKPGIVG